MKQGTAEWFEARMGKATASRISDVMAKTKAGYGAGRRNYMATAVSERLTGQVAEHYVSKEMQWGTDNEGFACTEYELRTGRQVESEGFVDHPTIPMSGASPDGLVGSDGLLEIKCPGTATHILTLLGGNIDKGYIKQMQWQMACTERQWCDFVSYDPRLPENIQLHIERVPRDDGLIKEIEREVIVFLSDLDKLEAKLRAYTTATEPAAAVDKNDTGMGNEMVVTEETGVTLKQESFLPKDEEVF